MLYNPCQSCPSLTILVPLWFIIISLVFSYLSKVLFSGLLQFKSYFVDAQNNSKYRDWAPLRGEKLEYKSVAKEISKPPFLAPEVQWASKFAVFVQQPITVMGSWFVRFTFPLNVSNHAHIWYVTWPQYSNTFCQNTALPTTCSMRLRKCTIFRKL